MNTYAHPIRSNLRRVWWAIEDKPAIGVAFAAVGLALILLVVIGTHLLRVYGPELREFIHWLLTPQLVLGMLAMAMLVCVSAMVMAWEARR